MSNWEVTVTDLDPERVAATHMFQIRLEYAPRTDPECPGGSYTFDVPGEHWARILEISLQEMTDFEIYELVDQYS